MKKRLFLMVLCFAVLFCSCASPGQLLRSWNNELPPSAGIIYLKDETALISEPVFSMAAGDMTLQFSAASSAENQQALLTAYAQNDNITALCCQLSSDSDAAALTKIAASYDKPLILWGQEPSFAVLDSYDQCWYVGSREREAGELMGKIAVDALQAGRFIDGNQNKLVEYILFTGSADTALATDRGEAALSVMENAGYFSMRVEAAACATDVQSAYETTLSLLDAGTYVELFICPHAEDAEGVVRALEERGALWVETPELPDEAGGASPQPLVRYGIVCTEKNEAVAALIARRTILGCSYFDASAAADTILTLARNASLRTNPSDGLSYIMEEHRRIYIPYLTEIAS